MAQRRGHSRQSIDHQYMSRAARKLVWIMRGIPSQEWAQ
jgi:hypothetical protein